MNRKLVQSSEFEKWFNKQPDKTKLIITARLERIQNEGHWGTVNKFNGLIELKWKSGLRVYTAQINKEIIVILAGGNKNGQNYDIKKARKILKQFIQNL